MSEGTATERGATPRLVAEDALAKLTWPTDKERIAELEMEVRRWKALAMVALQRAAVIMNKEAQELGEPDDTRSTDV